MVVRGKRGFTPRTFFRASSVPSEMSPKDTWTSEQLHASNQSGFLKIVMPDTPRYVLHLQVRGMNNR